MSLTLVALALAVAALLLVRRRRDPGTVSPQWLERHAAGRRQL